MRNFWSKTARQFSLGFAGCLLLSFSGVHPSSRDVPLLKRIRDYWKEGDLTLAKKQICAYLEKNPEGDLSQELRLLLGDLYVQEGNFATALQEYSALQKTELQQKSLYNRSICLYETGEYKELYSLTKSVLYDSFLSSEELGALKYLCARGLLQSKEPEVANDAITLLEGCKGTSFSSQALLSLAALYEETGEPQKASKCYLTLAEEDLVQAPDLFFRAALLEAPSNPKFALELFEKVLCSGSRHKPDAAYNTLILLYQTEEFDRVSQTYEEKSFVLSNDQKKQASFLLGKSLQHLKEYAKASPYLTEIALSSDAKKEVRTEAAFLALTGAYITKDLNTYRAMRAVSSDLGIEGEDRINLDLSYIELLKMSSDQKELIAVSESFLQNNPNHPAEKTVYIALIRSLYETGQWQNTKEKIELFLKRYPESGSTELLRLQLNCTGLLLEQNPEYRKEWITLTQTVLGIENGFSLSEKEHYQLELAKNLFLENRFSDALSVVEEYLTEFSSSSSVEEGKLLEALCYLNDPDSSLLFALHGEKFLETYPQNSEAGTVRIHLFNTYLKQSADSSSLQSELLEKAANHLYSVFEKAEHKIQKENMRWLADHYYVIATKEKGAALPRAIALLEAGLKDPQLGFQLDDGVYKLSKLFSIAGDLPKKATLLENWITSSDSPETALQKVLLFELADSYKMLGINDKAVQTYNILILSGGASEIAAKSLFEKSKILFSTLKPEEKNEENPLCVEILDDLKNLENGKNLATEPLHLEAGIEYLEYKSSLSSDPASRLQTKEKLLTLFKERMESDYTPEALSEKTDLFLAYTKFVEAELLLCNPNAEGNKETARILLNSLLENPSVPASLEARVKLSLELETI